MKIAVKRERETKNTVRFAEVPPQGSEPAMETVYLKKAALDSAGLTGEEELEIEVRAKS